MAETSPHLKFKEDNGTKLVKYLHDGKWHAISPYSGLPYAGENKFWRVKKGDTYSVYWGYLSLMESEVTQINDRKGRLKKLIKLERRLGNFPLKEDEVDMMRLIENACWLLDRNVDRPGEWKKVK